MKVLFVSRSTIFTVPGGDTIQMKNTAVELEKLGVEVAFYSESESIDFNEFDVIHFFNITRPSIILSVMEKTDKPFVLSPIFVEYDFYAQLKGFNVMGWCTKLFGFNGIEYIKSTAKHFLGKEKLEYKPYLYLGQKKAIQKVLSKTKILLPNSESEMQRMLSKYAFDLPYMVVPNGVDTSKFVQDASLSRKRKTILCAALIEPRKNQLNLIKAVNGTDYELVCVGSPAPNHLDYLEKCKAIAGSNVKIIDRRIPQEELMKLYQTSEIHVLVSWFETTGLSTLEAAYMGCKIVISKCGDTEDYFKDWAHYAEPDSVESIKNAIDQSHHSEYTEGLKYKIKESYNWVNAAQVTKKAYEKIGHG